MWLVATTLITTHLEYTMLPSRDSCQSWAQHVLNHVQVSSQIWDLCWVFFFYLLMTLQQLRMAKPSYLWVIPFFNERLVILQ